MYNFSFTQTKVVKGRTSYTYNKDRFLTNLKKILRRTFEENKEKQNKRV